MKSNINERITGVLFISATLAGLLSAIFLGTTLESISYLNDIATNVNQIYLVAFFEMIMAFSVAGIAISMYPVLKNYNSGMALGSVSLRIMEGVLFLIGTLFLLILVGISEKYVESGTNEAYFTTLGEIFKSNLPWTIGGISFTLGAFIYYILFYQTKLIPRWISIFGIISVLFAFASYISQFFGVDLGDFEAILHLPMLIQEMVFAVWLIIKGYDVTEDKI